MSTPKHKGLIDPKVRNLTLYVLPILLTVGGGVYAFTKYSTEKDPIKVFGYIVLILIIWRVLLHMYRRLFLPPKHPRDYGKWAIVTGSTSGIGKEFAEEFARLGMSIMLISRTESKLKEQADDISNKYKVNVKYMVYDFSTFSSNNTNSKLFYNKLKDECKILSKDGGLGILLNNVGTNEDHPMLYDEYDDDGVDNMINCNVQSVLYMTKTVLPIMKLQKNGTVISIGSGSANHPGPYNALYSATKAFMLQFSRSMHVENWDTGVDFLCVTPFYIVSNLYKRKSGTILAPMPIELVKGTISQLGKKYIWQGHGYWFHGMLGNMATYFWGTTARWRKMMVDNRKRWDERQAANANANANANKESK